MSENNKTPDYEPNFILKEDQPADNEPAADAAETEAAKAGEAEAMKAEAPKAEASNTEAPKADTPKAEAPKTDAPKAETPKAEAPSSGRPASGMTAAQAEATRKAADTLKAMAAKAEALKASAAKAEQASEPYRRQTEEMASPVDPVDPMTARRAGSANGAGHTNSSNRSGSAAAGAATGAATGAAAGFGSAASNGYSRSGASNGFAGAGRTGSANSAGNRPKYENPSFDPGQTGHYTDPRDSFRFGESASWSNGEFHSSRRAVKDSINKHKQKAHSKASQPVTLTRRALGLLIAGCLCLSCLFGLGGAALGTTLVKQDMADTAQTTTAAASSGEATTSTAGYSLENATGSQMTVKEITAASKNSVVEIRTESVSSDTWMQQYVTEGAGSGVIISEDGYIMTNNHVIEGANKIKVTTADEKEYEATLVGTDDTNDVAVIKIDASGLDPVTYGNSDELEVGDMAVAIGNPLGELGGTVTAGIISATDRELAIDGKTLHLLQTDSSINPGNSGGGLFNGSGQLIGLVVAKSSGSDVEGLGFAIPVNTAADVAQQLIEKGYVSGQPSTGMTYQEGSSSGSSPFDSFFGSTASGVYIYSVNGENAKKAGFEAGDQVYAVDGEEITSFDQLSAIVTAHEVGDTLKFTIIRNGTQKNIKLELEEKQNVEQNTSGTENGQDQNGQTPDGSQDLPDQGGQDNGQGEFGQDGGQNGGQDDFSQGDSWQDWFSMFF